MSRTAIPLAVIAAPGALVLLSIVVGRYLAYQRKTTTRLQRAANGNAEYRVTYPRLETGKGHVRRLNGHDWSDWSDEELGHG
jgi:hypothetical protein